MAIPYIPLQTFLNVSILRGKGKGKSAIVGRSKRILPSKEGVFKIGSIGVYLNERHLRSLLYFCTTSSSRVITRTNFYRRSKILCDAIRLRVKDSIPLCIITKEL